MSEKIKKLQDEKAQLQKKTIIVIVLIAVSFLATPFNYTIGIIGFIIAMVLYVLILRKGRKEYKHRIKETMMVEGYRSYFKEPEYHEHGGISAENVVEQKFIPVENTNSLMIKDGVTGKYRYHSLVLAEVTSDFHSVKKDKKGEEKSFVDFMSGVLFEIDLGSKDLSFPEFMIWRKSALPEAVREKYYSSMKVCTLGQDGSEKEIQSDQKLRKTDDISASLEKRLGKRYLLLIQKDDDETQIQNMIRDEESPLNALCEAFLRLAAYTPGQIALQLKDGKLRVFIRTRFLYTIDVPVKTEVTNKLLTYCDFPEISYLLRIADTLM